MIKVRHVTKSYGEGDNLFTALDDVTFSVPIGASVAIVGKSGSGKTAIVMHAVVTCVLPSEGPWMCVKCTCRCQKVGR